MHEDSFAYTAELFFFVIFHSRYFSDRMRKYDDKQNAAEIP